MTLRQHLLVASLVLLAAIWQFEGVRHAGFVFQDYRWSGAFTAAQPPFLGLQSIGRLTANWLWWSQEQFTPSPIAFHIVSLVLHALAAAMVAILTVRLGGSPLGAWAAGSIFLLNSTQMASAIYLSERTEVLAAIGVLGACIVLCNDITPTRLVVAAAFAVSGFMGKESAVVVLALVPAVRRRWVGYVVAMEVLIVVVYAVALHRSYAAEGWWPVTQAAAAARVLWTTVTLTGNTADHDYEAMSMVLKAVNVAALLAVLYAGWLFKEHKPLVGIGAAWVAAVIAPRLLVSTPGSPFNESHFYLATAGLAIAASGLFGRNKNEIA